MFRTILVLVGLFSTVVLLAEGLAIGLLYSRGYLTPTALREMQAALVGSASSEPEDVVAKEKAETQSQEETRMARVTRILDLTSREEELTLLKQSTSETANRLISEQRAFDELKAAFEKRLTQLEDQARSEATEQIRTVLLAMPPEDAVQRLMGLSKDDGVHLLRGLPEKSISRILQAFSRDEKAAARGQELFEALYRGEPKRSLLEATQDQLQPSAARPTPKA